MSADLVPLLLYDVLAAMYPDQRFRGILADDAPTPAGSVGDYWVRESQYRAWRDRLLPTIVGPMLHESEELPESG